MDNRSSRSLRLIILLPFLFSVLAWWFYSQVVKPLPVYVNADPEVPYLMSSLSVFKGESYSFIDHPGTPVEILGTLLLGISYPIVGNLDNSFVLEHIAHPISFLLVARTLLTLISMAAIILLALYTVPGDHWTDAVASVAVSLLFFGIHPRAFNSIVHWSHNSFGFPVGALIGLVLVLTVSGRMVGSRRQMTFLGFSIGVLAAIQIYFVTWLVGAVVAQFAYLVLSTQGWKKGLLSSLMISLAALVGFFCSTLPIVGKYKEFASWIVRVASYQGRHGSGSPGFISLQQAAQNFLDLWKDLRVLYISIAIVVVLLAVMVLIQRRNLNSNPGLWALALGLSVQIGTMSALVIKHPGIIYMQAVAATLPLLLAVAFALLPISAPKMIAHRRLIQFGLSIGILFLFVVNLARSYFIHNLITAQVDFAVEEIEQFIDEVAQDLGRERQSLNTLWVYGMPSRCLALWYGNQYADHTFAEEISLICPRDFVYNLWEKRVITADGSSVPLEESTWDIVVANEAALLDFPDLADIGRVVYSEAQLGTFGKVVYLLRPH